MAGEILTQGGLGLDLGAADIDEDLLVQPVLVLVEDLLAAGAVEASLGVLDQFTGLPPQATNGDDELAHDLPQLKVESPVGRELRHFGEARHVEVVESGEDPSILGQQISA